MRTLVTLAAEASGLSTKAIIGLGFVVLGMLLVCMAFVTLTFGLKHTWRYGVGGILVIIAGAVLLSIHR